MIKEALFSRDGLPWIRTGMGVSRLRHRINAENIANAVTPGFRAARVAFEEHLAKAAGASLPMAATRDGHLAASGTESAAKVVAAADPMLPNGVNNVDVEKEFALLGWNRVQYSALTRFASRQYRLLNEAIGRRGG